MPPDRDAHARPQVLSVVIPARDVAHTLPDQLRALQAQAYGGAWEVVVADNGSTDDTRDVLRQATRTMANLRWVDASRVRGSNATRNLGARAARGDFLLFVDADDLVRPGWLDAMARAAQHCEVVGGVLHHTIPGPHDAPEPAHESTELISWPGFLAYPSGANCGLRASLLWEVGGFDEAYTAGGDDAELFWRLQLRGHRVCVARDAVVEYRERSTWRRLAAQFFGYGVQDPHLFRDFRDSGMPGRSVATALRAWAHLLLLAPWYWWTPQRRRQWVKSVARRAGRIAGSRRWRVLYL